MAPLFSALFLAIVNSSRLGVPLDRELAIVLTPSIPRPALSIEKIFKEFAYSKNELKAIAPNGLTALSEMFREMICLLSIPEERKPIAYGNSFFNLATNISLMSTVCFFNKSNSKRIHEIK